MQQLMLMTAESLAWLVGLVTFVAVWAGWHLGHWWSAKAYLDQLAALRTELRMRADLDAQVVHFRNWADEHGIGTDGEVSA